LNRTPDRSPLSSDLLIDDQTQQQLLNLVRSLPERQREAIMLHYFEDRPVEEGAALMECTVSTFKVLLHQGRKRLGTLLEKEEI
jgi:RNA polymerase sigma factor (sigma-70 family)